MKERRNNRGGTRPGAGRKPKGDRPREYTNIRIERKAYEAIPPGVSKCDYVSGLILSAAKESRD